MDSDTRRELCEKKDQNCNSYNKIVDNYWSKKMLFCFETAWLRFECCNCDTEIETAIRCRITLFDAHLGLMPQSVNQDLVTRIQIGSRLIKFNKLQIFGWNDTGEEFSSREVCSCLCSTTLSCWCYALSVVNAPPPGYRYFDNVLSWL